MRGRDTKRGAAGWSPVGMAQPGPAGARQRSSKDQRVYAAVRTALVGYGAAAFAYLNESSWTASAPQALGNWGTARGVVLLGLGLQVALVLARALLKRHAPDRAASAQGMLILEIIADGVTVLLFAAGTLGAITHGAEHF